MPTSSLNRIRASLIALGMLGALLFALAFGISFANPGWVEKIGRDIIHHQVEKKVHEKIEALDSGFLVRQAGHLARGYSDEVARARRDLANGLPAKIAGIVSEMANLDCECRQKVEKDIHDGYLAQITNASQAKARLDSLIRTKYMQTVDQLLREFRIFTGSNAVVFALLAAAGLTRKKADLHLLPGAFVLLAAAGVTAFLYLFEQDSLHTLVFGDYVGLGYVAYLGAATALLGDVILNRARLTSEILSQCFSALGNGLVVTPC